MPKFMILTAFKTKAFAQLANLNGTDEVLEKPITQSTLNEIIDGISLK